MDNIESFDESAWSHIEGLLPYDENVRRIILDDFMWFVRRPKKYKNDLQKAEDYIRHLRLKANTYFMSTAKNAEAFRIIDIDRIESLLQSLLLGYYK